MNADAFVNVGAYSMFLVLSYLCMKHSCEK
jgi:hypothetical protein